MKTGISGPVEIDESLGEIICNKCEGSKLTNKGVYGNVPCEKCNGTGKLDWVSKAMERPKLQSFSFGTSGSVGVGYNAGFSVTTGNYNTAIGNNPGSHNSQNDMIDAMAKQISDSIDKEILDNLVSMANKHIKLDNSGGNVA